MEKPTLITCNGVCYCHFCDTGIGKGENYLRIDKSAWRGTARTNICACCLRTLISQVRKQDEQAIENRIVLKELENGK